MGKITEKIGSARIDERGKASGGKAGDQTGGEVSEQTYYTHKKGWYLLRPYDANIADRLALAMRAACSNPHIGYDQNQRTTLITQLKAVLFRGGMGHINVDVECDCSSLVRACILEATGRDVGNFTTANEKEVLIKSGLFYLKDFTWPHELRQGDVLVTKTKGHTGIITAGAKRTTYVNTAFVTAYSLTVRSGPGTNFVAVGYLHKRERVLIFEEQGTWARIGDGRWCSTKFLEYV